MTIEHEKDHNRFVIRFSEGVATLNYQLIGDVMNIMHTAVPDEHEGEGVGSELVRAAMEWARGEGKQVESSCRFARSWLERHEEYADVLA